jgi:hypothetical protein
MGIYYLPFMMQADRSIARVLTRSTVEALITSLPYGGASGCKPSTVLLLLLHARVCCAAGHLPAVVLRVESSHAQMQGSGARRMLPAWVNSACMTKYGLTSVKEYARVLRCVCLHAGKQACSACV